MLALHKLPIYISKAAKSINNINVGCHYYKEYPKYVSLYCYYNNIIMHLMKHNSVFVVKFRVFGSKYKYITIDFNQFRYVISGTYHYYINYNLNRVSCKME